MCAFFFFFSGVSVATCMAILHVGSAQQVRTGSTSSKEEDYESDAATIVQKCVSYTLGVQEPRLFKCGNMAWLGGRTPYPYPFLLGSRSLRGRRSFWQIGWLCRKQYRFVGAVDFGKMSHSVSKCIWGLSIESFFGAGVLCASDMCKLLGQESNLSYSCDDAKSSTAGPPGNSLRTFYVSLYL